MIDKLDWLPELILLSDYGGRWEKYVEAVYAIFKKDFVDAKPVFRGTRLGLKRHPLEQGKEATFWHLISEGDVESERTPDLRRCERIRWPRPVVEHCDDDQETIKIWENERGQETRLLLWLEAHEYLVILAKRKSYILPWTAFLVTHEHRKKKLRQEYEAFKKANAANK